MRNSRQDSICTVREGLGKGYLTVFLTLILTVMLSFGLTIIVSARENTRRFMAECVTDIAMNSILAEYHRELLEQYNMFFVDASYGTQVLAYENMTDHLKNYIHYNLQGEDLFLQEAYGNLLHMELENITVTGARSACQEGGRALRRQAVEAIKQDVGITSLEKISTWVQEVQDSGIMEMDLSARQKEAEAKVEELTGKKSGTLFRKEEKEDSAVSLWEAGFLNLVAPREEFSSREITPLNYVSHRVCFESGGLSAPENDTEDFTREMMFHEYLLSYTGRYGREKENALLSYETEYLLAGKAGDLDNLKSVVSRILFIRGGADYISLMRDEKKKACAQKLAESLAVMLGVPEAEEAFTVLLEILWSMAEALYDVSVLLKGGCIPLIKEPEEWYYDIENAVYYEKPGQKQSTSEGLAYEDYLRLLMCFQEKEVLTMRLADLMEMDIRSTPGNENFRMDGCFEAFRVQIDYRGGSDKTYRIERTYGYTAD